MIKEKKSLLEKKNSTQKMHQSRETNQRVNGNSTANFDEHANTWGKLISNWKFIIQRKRKMKEDKQIRQYFTHNFKEDLKWQKKNANWLKM